MGTWMIRAGRGGTYATSRVGTSIVGIGESLDGVDITYGLKKNRDMIEQAACNVPTENTVKLATGDLAQHGSGRGG